MIRRQGREAERKQEEGRSGRQNSSWSHGEVKVRVNNFEVYLEVRELFEELVEVLEEEEKKKEREKEEKRQRDKSGTGN